jgi:hypothetical protein
VFANAINADQAAPFEIGFELVLARYVFFGRQVLAERIPGSDEGRAKGVVLGHERFEFRARLTNVQGERTFVVNDVLGLVEGLQKLSGYRVFHESIHFFHH